MYLKNLLLVPSLWGAIKPKPKYLYKFHSLNKHLEDLLTTNSLWGSSAIHLNDPYDCEIELTKEYIGEKYLSQITLEEMGVNISQIKDERSFRKRILEYMEAEDLSEMQELFRAHIRVCCFTSTPLSELMWSHYANSGKGVCLQFSFSSDLLKPMAAVKYSNKRITITNDIERFKAMFYKRKAWSYEKEWRIILDNDSLEFPKTNLVTIIFGPRTSEEEIKTIIDICTKYDYNTTYSKCRYSKKGLVIENLI